MITLYFLINVFLMICSQREIYVLMCSARKRKYVIPFPAETNAIYDYGQTMKFEVRYILINLNRTVIKRLLNK